MSPSRSPAELRIGPTPAFTLFDDGLYANQAQFENAFAMLTEARKLAPHDPTVAGQIVHCARQAGITQGIDSFDFIIELG